MIYIALSGILIVIALAAQLFMLRNDVPKKLRLTIRTEIIDRCEVYGVILLIMAAISFILEFYA